ncbi:MAG: SDR family NAD(P)-dependent oxidoreductase, partial [Deltaproteobacteria bacterium]|nr:SDR family NAD(P)-dependent oxidoreductase [Deltaproteobacteria bacterium]
MRLAVVSERAQLVDERDELLHPWQASAWGMMRSAVQEISGLEAQLVDVWSYEEAAEAIASELSVVAQDEEICLRPEQGRYVSRLVRAEGGLTVPAAADNWRLDTHRRGTLDRLQIVAAPRTASLGSREIEIAVERVGLNFRDVLNVLGEYPGDPGAPGGDCAGRVTRIGADVERFKIGDRVFGFAVGCVARFAVTDERLVAVLPSNMSQEQAVTQLSTALTADLGLVERARLRRGERILIHAAAGGLGLAAIQVSQRIGAEIFATASKSKHDYLRQLGVNHVFDSRSTGFYEEVLAATGGEGVDVVLNSLTGDKLRQSVRLLRPGGRFIEVGKADLLSPQAFSALNPSASYHAVALDELMKKDPGWFPDAFERLERGWEEGSLTPLPVTRFALREARAAFRFLGQGRNVGKVVIDITRDALEAKGSYVVSGGLGALGLTVAGWLVERGVEEIVLVGRKAPDARSASRLERLRATGVTVVVEQGDVSRREDVARICAAARTRTGRIAAIVHAAGVLRDATLRSQSWPKYEEVLWPKILGAKNLMQEADAETVFVSFSSISGVLGNVGQSSYAAANAVLDALAAQQSRLGRRHLSIAWGPWAEAGMAAQTRSTVSDGMLTGLRALSNDDGLRILDALWDGRRAGITILCGDVTELGQRYEASGVRVPAKLRELVRRDGAPRGQIERTTDFARELAALEPNNREQRVQTQLLAELRSVMGADRRDAGIDEPLMDLGVDSLMAIDLRNRLSALLGKPLPATFVFDFPTISALSRAWLERAGLRDAEPSTTATSRPAPARSAEDEPAVAIVGLACRFPGGATDEDGYWQLLSHGQDGIVEVPKDRWDIDAFYDPDPDVPGKMSTRWGGFLRDVDVAAFDPQFFGIAPKEARLMDPQQRLLLECVAEGLENAGYAAPQLAGSRTGVFVGLSTNDYSVLLATLGRENIDEHRGTGNASSVAAGRISFCYGLQGPAMTLDTACSSSLYALHYAVQSLRRGECNLAIVGAANLILAPDWTIYFSRGRFMAPDGRCKTFDEEANGYVRGEGCGVLILKRLVDVEPARDRVRCVIRGTAVNQDGRSGGLTVPSGPAQEAVIRAAMDDARLQPRDISYVEAHGTGTALGDPIEVNALVHAYGRDRPPERPLLVGSVKTNIGHLEAAAGMASIIKVVLALENEQIPGQIGLSKPSRKIAWDESALSVVTNPLPWKRRAGALRRAGLSCFAFQGSNAHVILEEPPALAESPATEAAAERPIALLLLSARSERSLQAIAALHLDVLKAEGSSLHDVAHSAGLYRAHYEERLAIVAADVEEAVAKLEAFVGARSVQGPGVVRGRASTIRLERKLGAPGDFSVDPRFSGPDRMAALQQLVRAYGLEGELAVDANAVAVPTWRDLFERLAEAYVQGAHIDLAAIDRPWPRRRVDLPSYQFDRGRYWAAPAVGTTRQEPTTLLGSRLVRPEEPNILAFEVKTSVKSAFGDHEFFATPVWPAAGHIWRACQAVWSDRPGMPPIELSAFAVDRPVFLRDEPTLQVVLDRSAGRLTTYVSDKGTSDWAPCSAVTIAAGSSMPEPLVEPAQDLKTIDMASQYIAMAEDGTELGPAFRTIIGLQVAEGHAVVKIESSSQRLPHERAVTAFDACLQAVAVLGRLSSGPRVAMPIGIDRLFVARDFPASGRAVVRLEKCDATKTVGDFDYYDDGGRLVCAARGLQFRAARREVVLGEDAAVKCYVEQWQPRALETAPGGERGRALEVYGDAGASAEIVEALAGVAHLPALTQAPSQTLASRDAIFVVPSGGEVDARVITDYLAVARACQAGGAALHLVTQRSQSPDDEPCEPDVMGASLWCAARAIAHEGIHGRRIDVGNLREDASAIPKLLRAGQDEDEIVVRGGRTWVNRIVSVGRRGVAPPALDADGLYLLTGGFGGLGATLMEWLARRGAAHVLVVGRRAIDQGTIDEQCRSSGLARVTYVAADLKHDQSGAAIEAAIASTARRIRGVIHAAGVARDVAFGSLTAEQLHESWDAKVMGASRLMKLLRDQPTLFWLNLSSVASLLGNGGQSAYAAANGVLDALAQSAQGRALHMRSVRLGPVAGRGLFARLSSAQQERVKRLGFRPAPLSSVGAALDHALANESRVTSHLEVEWVSYAASAPFQRRRLEALISEKARAPQGELALRLEQMPEVKRAPFVRELVRAEVAATMDFADPSSIPIDKPLMDLGLDSLMAQKLRQRLNETTGLSLPSTIVFDHPSIAALATQVLARMQNGAPGARAAKTQRRAAENGATAIVGMAGRFPGSERVDLDAYWQTLKDGSWTGSKVPRERYDIDQYFHPDADTPGKIATRLGSFLRGCDVAAFDPGFFGIAAKEALTMDPQQRMLLECVVEA